MADVDAAAAPAARTKSPTKAAASGAAAPTREPRKRTRSPPPASPKGRSRRELPTHAVEILKAWLTSPQHFHHPSTRRPEDQQSLMAQTGIDKKQLKNWFTNARRRIWKPMQRSAASHDYDEDGVGYYEEDESRAAHDVLAFASAADRARAVTVDSAGSSPSSHPAEGGLFDDFVLDAPAPSLRPPKRARTEPSIKCAVPLLPPRPGGHAAHALRAPLPRAMHETLARGDGHDARLPAVFGGHLELRPRDGRPRRARGGAPTRRSARHTSMPNFHGTRRGREARVDGVQLYLRRHDSKNQNQDDDALDSDQDFTPLASNHALQSWASGTTALNAAMSES